MSKEVKLPLPEPRPVAGSMLPPGQVAPSNANNKTSNSDEMDLNLEEVDDIDTLMSRLYLQANSNDIKKINRPNGGGDREP